MTADADVRQAIAADPAASTPAPEAGLGPDLPAIYQSVRIRIAPIALILTLTVATVTGWPNGPWVPISALAITVHALYVQQRGSPGPITLVIDGAAVALATLTMSIPVVTATAFSFFAVVASILTAGRKSVVVSLCTAGWVGASLAWSYAGVRGPYEPQARMIIELAAVFFFAASISVLVAVVMRRLRQAEQQRLGALNQAREANVRLENLLESKDRFVASVSHELRTPLTAVVGLSQELAASDVSYEPGEVREMQQMVAEEAKELAAIVEDLLVAARSDIGEVAIFTKVVPLEPLVREVLDSTEAATGRSVFVAGDATAVADPVRVKQIVRNLVTNCLRYGGDNIRIGIVSTEREAIVEVADNGLGIDESKAGTIFEPYATAEPGGRHVKSVGLGLTVARTLARLMDGDLRYRRDPGWTVFAVSLPAGESF